MSASINKAIIIGNVGQDAVLRYTPGGQPVTSFSLATSESWTDKAGVKKESTEWHRIVLWGKQAETMAPYLTKGKSVYVEGSLTTRQWEKEGQKHYTTDIKAQRLQLLGSARDREEMPEPVGVAAASPYDPPVATTDDDIPF